MTNTQKERDIVESIKIEIVKGVEGLCVVINDFRICGSKPWAGGSIINSWDIDTRDFERALPDIMKNKELKAQKELLAEIIEYQINNAGFDYPFETKIDELTNRGNNSRKGSDR